MAIIANEKILTLDYWKRADQVVVGDYVFDRKGQPVKVKSVQHFHSENCYWIQLNDLMGLSVNGTNKFQLETPKYRLRALEYKGVRKFMRPLLTLSVNDLLEKPLVSEKKLKYFSIPTCEPLQFPHQDLPVPPFVFGYWYWNRTKPNSFSVKKENKDFVVRKFKESGYEVIKTRDYINEAFYFKVSPSIESQLAPFIPNEIPNNYLLSSHEQRIELLSGIINSRTSYYKPKDDHFKIGSIVWSEIRKLQSLVESIGCKTSLYHKKYINTYVLQFKSRYKLCEYQDSPPIRVHQTRRYITEIKQIEPQQCVHIETDGPDGSFLVGEGFIACR
jgi:hypothetical protein